MVKLAAQAFLPRARGCAMLRARAGIGPWEGSQMRLWKVLCGGFAAAAMLVSAPALANPKNALDAYVAKPDPAFAWKVAGQVSGPGYHGAVLELTSQSWLTSKQVDHPVWKHWLTVVVP